MKVKYMYESDKSSDLVCELTEFMDTFLIDRLKDHMWMKTYLWESIDDGKRIAFRVPGATRGCLDLEKKSENIYRIINIHFYNDTCFGKNPHTLECYKTEVVEGVEKYIGQELDFSEVKLNQYGGNIWQ